MRHISPKIQGTFIISRGFCRTKILAIKSNIGEDVTDIILSGKGKLSIPVFVGLMGLALTITIIFSFIGIPVIILAFWLRRSLTIMYDGTLDRARKEGFKLEKKPLF